MRAAFAVLIAAAALFAHSHGMPPKTDDQAANEYGEYFQGDMMEPFPGAFAGLLNPENRWPNNVLVYRFDPDFPEEMRARVLEAMSRVAQETGGCVQFREWSPELDGVECVVIRSGSGCSAVVGYWAGRSTNMNLAERCTVGNIMHELQHCLGVEHQQSRPDRDDYVRINFDNITPGSELNFIRESSRYYDTYGQPYDFGSQMHYSLTAYSRNGLPTIEPLPGRLPEGVQVGQRDRMSQADVALVRAMYACQTARA